MVEYELEGGIIDEFLEFPYVGLGLVVVDFEAETKVLVVKDADVSLRVVEEGLEDPAGINQVAVKEGREVGGVFEDLLLCGELTQRSHIN